MGTLFLIEVIKVGTMLEVICVNVAVFSYVIRLNVVGATVIFLSSELLLFEEEQPVRAKAASAKATIPAKRAIAAFFEVRE